MINIQRNNERNIGRRRENLYQYRNDVGFEFINKQNFRDVKREEQELYEKQQATEKFKKLAACERQQTTRDLSSTLFQTLLLYGIIKNANMLFQN